MTFRVGAITNAFRSARWMKGCVRQFDYTDVYRLVLCNSTSWNGNLEADYATYDAAREAGADEVRVGRWASAQEQFNWGLDYFQKRGFDWVILVDADERWAPEGVRQLLRDMEDTEYDVVRPSLERRYWKTTDYIVTPDPADRAYAALRPHLRVQNIRWPGPLPWRDSGATLHHFSYVRTDDEMHQKILANDDYRDREREPLERWYATKWLNWEPGMTDLHPVWPSQFAGTAFMPAPEEVVALL